MKKRFGIRGNKRGVVIYALILLSVCIGCTAWIASTRTPEEGVVELLFLDIGQGDSTFITTEEGCVLIDTGIASEAQFLHSSILLYQNRLEAMLITHLHSDHMGGAEYILENMQVENLFLPAAAQNDPDAESLIHTALGNQTKIYYCTPETEFRLGGAVFSVLAPLADYPDENNRSLVVRMDYGSVSALFTGDAEAESEGDQLALYGSDVDSRLHTDILKVGHHGSDTSSTFAYLRAVSPTWAVISCGQDNSYGHPSQDILTRLSELNVTVFRTDRDGSICIRTDGRSITTP